MERETFERMKNEHEELFNRTVKLREFILNKEEFEKECDPLNRDLCIGQLHSMESYLSFLAIRLGLNNKPTQDDVIEEVTAEEA